MTAYSKFTAMVTDLYELTMAQVYFQRRMIEPAIFSLFIREYPPHRGYFVSAGLENALAFLESARFMSDDIQYLDSTGLFSRDFLNYLEKFRFTGNVAAIPEGELFFKDEPVLEVTAPIIESQLVETALVNIIHLHVILATKVSRCVHAARGRGIVDFSLRRTHGVDAGMAVARAGYIAGMSATSNVLAGKIYSIPVAGTMAHSFITSFDSEIDAFRAFADIFGDRTVLLIDTYDTLVGAEKAVTVARELKKEGRRLRGVRLDSGDMTALSRQVRELFCREGFPEVEIFASGGYDEFKIDRSIREGAEIDAFGVGTKMGVSADSPYADIAYKLVQFNGRPVMKLSSGKRTLVAPKQVFREERKGCLIKDTITLREESLAGRPLLKTVMQGGKAITPPERLKTIRDRFKTAFGKLPEGVRAIRDPRPYPVGISEQLEALQRRVRHSVIAKELGES